MKPNLPIISFYLLIFIASAGSNSIKFQNISTRDGLSQSTVSAIYRDQQGFMWIGTGAGGLNRFDGYKFKTFKPNPTDSTSLSNAYIQFITEISSSDSTIFLVGTQAGGLNIFDKKTETFSKLNYFPESPGKNRLFDDLSMMCADKLQNLWIGSYTGGLLKYDVFEGSTTIYKNIPGNMNSISTNKTNYVYCDNKGFIWIGTMGSGLDCFDPSTQIFYHFLHDPANPSSLSNNYVWCIYEDKKSNLWIGTKSGLNRLILDEFYTSIKNNNQQIPSFQRFIHDKTNKNSLGGNWILSILEDNNEILWVGSYGGGISCLNKEHDNFITFKHDPDNLYSLSNDDVMVIYDDTTDHIIWIGTDGGGLDKFYYGQKKFEKFSYSPGSNNSISGQTVFAVLRDTYDKLWIGTQSRGLDCIDLKTRKLINYRHSEDDPQSLPNDKVTSLIEDHLGRIWAGTMNGLACFDRSATKFINYQPTRDNKVSASPNWVNFICQDPKEKDILWLATEEGLVKFNCVTGVFESFKSDLPIRGTQIWNLYSEYSNDTHYLLLATVGEGLLRVNTTDGSFSQYKFDPSNDHSLNDNNINSIYRDQSGTLWLGSQSGGLNKLDNNEGRFKHFTIKHGLPTNYISSIIADNRGYLWLGTNRGLCRFNPVDETCVNFTELDGLLSDEFWPWTSFKDSEGNIYLGGPGGFIRFHPDNIQIKINMPNLVFTD